jgi:recombination protein RecT
MADQKPSSASAALAQRRENGDVAVNTLADTIRKMQKEFSAAMPQGAEATQLVRDAITALRKTPLLAKCQDVSVLGALMTCAQLGLRVGVLGQAWPLPFYDNKTRSYQAQLIIGYQGYSELAHRSQKVQSFIPRTVHANDEFDVDYGVTGTLTHRPALRGPRGEVVGFHSIARYANGGYDFLFMTVEEMREHRDRFATTRGKDGRIFGPWVDHFEAMGNKTTQRLLAKHIPKSPELWVAQFVDGGLRLDINPKVAPEDATEPIREDVLDGQVLLPEEQAAPVVVDDRPMSEEQHRKVFALCKTADLEDRDKRLAYATQVIGRPMETFASLTAAEADKVIGALERFIEQQAGPW